VSDAPTDQFPLPLGSLPALDGMISGVPFVVADPNEPTPVWSALVEEFGEVPE
jgi:hypothetical protein